MRFSELEIALQQKMKNADYQGNTEIRNIVNRALKSAEDTIDFQMNLYSQIGTLLDDIRSVMQDILESSYTRMQSQEDTQSPPKESQR